MIDLDAIKSRCEAATPPPWTAAQYDGTHGDEGWDVASLPGAFVAFCRDCGAFTKRADAEFAAYAREDIPALVDEVERLSTECALYRAKIKRLHKEVTQ